jgi:hypothetical protein
MTQSPSNSNQPDWTARTAELQMIQGVINRMASNSFQVKGWIIALVVLTLQFVPQPNNFSLMQVVLPFAVITLAGWLFDAFFLNLERKYRWLYDQVIEARNQGDFTNMFSLNHRHLKVDRSCLMCAFFSRTLLLTYGSIVVYVGLSLYLRYFT